MPKTTGRSKDGLSAEAVVGTTIADRGRAVAARRKETTSEMIERAKRSIISDIERNLGIYPFGEITAAEVLRRAGLNIRILAKPRHHALRADVNKWVKDIQDSVVQGREVVRRALTKRSDAAKAETDLIRQRWIEAELEYVEARAQLAELQRRCADLESENERLLASIAGKNVVAIRLEER